MLMFYGVIRDGRGDTASGLLERLLVITFSVHPILFDLLYAPYAKPCDFNILFANLLHIKYECLDL